jgi:hypothetical protein
MKTFTTITLLLTVLPQGNLIGIARPPERPSYMAAAQQHVVADAAARRRHRLGEGHRIIDSFRRHAQRMHLQPLLPAPV